MPIKAKGVRSLPVSGRSVTTSGIVVVGGTVVDGTVVNVLVVVEGFGVEVVVVV
jgi:hypothetical protein